MKKVLFIAAISFLVACGKPKFEHSALVTGKITVADSVDQSKDYSNTEFIVLYRDTTAVADTLLRAATNKMGEFKGKVRFPKQGRYPVEIRRFKRIVSSYSIILGPSDTIRVEAELPGFLKTAKVTSNEQDAFDTYQRLTKNYDRILNVARAGKLDPDTLPSIARTWSNMYWELFEQERGTYASKLSAGESIRLLSGLDDSLIIVRTEGFKKESMMGQIAAVAGAVSRAKVQGLDNALAFIDELQKYHTEKDDLGSFIRLKVEMLADSGRIEEAVKMVRDNAKLDKDWKEFAYWRTAVETDLTKLAPGQDAPNFKIAVGKDSVSLADQKGNLVLLEFVGLANPTYQAQFDRIAAINLVYAPSGLTLITIPVDQNPALYDGFFQERALQWTFSNPGQFQESTVGDLYNVKTIPCRVLVSRDGKIVRKYAGANLELLFKDLQKQYAKENAS